jgi:hypothetical protein
MCVYIRILYFPRIGEREEGAREREEGAREREEGAREREKGARDS